jgi:hypothetical protein
VKSAQGQHLLEYLQRSEQVGEIRSDLVYLEGRGSTFGIDPSRAERLENAAVNGDRRAVADAFENANEDEAKGMLRLLAQVAREAPLGPEAANAVQTLLSAAAIKKDAAGQLADELLRAFRTHRHHYGLAPPDLAGALVLSLTGEGQDADEMLSEVIASRQVETEEELGLELIGAGQRVITADPDRAAMVFATWLDLSPVQTTTILLQLPTRDQDELLKLGTGLLEQRLSRRKERVTAGRDEEGNAIEDPDEAESLAIRNRGFAEAIELALAGERKQVAEALAISLLAANTKDARDLIEEHLADLAPVESTDLCSALLVAARRRAVPSWPHWLSPIQVDALNDRQEEEEEAAQLVRKLWEQATREEPLKAKHLQGALDALQPICNAVEVDQRTLDEEVAGSARGALVGTSVPRLDELREIAARFRKVGLLTETGTAEAFLGDLRSALNELSVDDPEATAKRAMQLVEAYGAEASPGTLQAILETATASPWLPQSSQSSLLLSVAAALADTGEEVDCQVPTEKIVELAGRGIHGAPAVAAWLRAIATVNEDVFLVLEQYGSRWLPDSVAEAIVQWCKREGSGEALWVAKRYYEVNGLARPPKDELLAALASCEPDDDQVADWLLALFRAANTNPERKGAMAAWRGFKPSDPAIRKRLIAEIYLPLGEEFKGAFKLVLKNINLVKDPPYGTKGEIKKTLRRQAEKHGLRRAAEYALEESGIDKARVSLRDKIRREESLDD